MFAESRLARPASLGAPLMTPATRAFLLKSFFILCAGGFIGTLMSFGAYATKIAYVSLLPIGLAMVIPAAVLKNFRLYWFAILLLSLQVAITKNLNDGRAVVDELHINYTIWTFTFQVSATDLVILVLLGIWANDRMFHNKAIRFPAVTWLAVGYFAMCLLSTIGTLSPYLGYVLIVQELKFFVVYLFAVNCVRSKGFLRVLAFVAVIILVTQGGMTLVRYSTGYVAPLIGSSQLDTTLAEKYLTVDREVGRGSGVRGFGTLDSPGSTTRLCMMVIPFALFLGVRNPMFKMPLVFAGLAVFGVLGLILTFTRVYFILAALQCGLVFLIMARDRILKRQEVTLLVLLGVAGLAAISPKLYEQFTIRADSVSVRFLQYEAAARMIADHPVFGVGINNATGLKPNYVDFSYNIRYAETQFYLEPTHNMYLSLASEIGVIGALFFLVFFGRAGWLAWRQSRDSPDPEIRMVASALVVVFVTVAVNGFMDPLQEYSALLLLWLYAGIVQNLPEMADPKKAEVRVPARKARAYGAAVSAPAR